MDLPDRILNAALPHIAFDGWTQGTLTRAAESAGLTAFDAKRAFPGGALDAVNHFTRRADSRMLAALGDMTGMKIRDKIAHAVMTRLRQQLPHREAVRRALALYTLHPADGLKSLYATTDAMWRAAGDTATDWNFYTKRLLLSGVYSSTLYVWLDDTTDGLAATEAFLRRRIENVMQIEKFKAKTREKFSSLEQWMPKFSARP